MGVMQKCKECGASWEIKRILEVCPFCGANLKEKSTADSIETAFKIILERHGQDVFQSGVLLGLLGDYAPSLVKERKLVKVAVESGAYWAICAASVAEREHVLNKYASLLTDSYFIDEMWARKALMWFINALAVDSHIETEDAEPSVNYRVDMDESAPIDADTSQSVRPKRKESVDPDLIINDGVLKKYRGTKRSLQLPSVIHTIASGAFHSNSEVCEIIIPDSVKVIKKSAFAYCTNLEDVTVSNGVKEIGKWAFVNCKKLKRIMIPDSVTNIGQYAFQGCLALTTVQLPNEMTEIQEGTFFDCKSLVSVLFPRNLKVIRNMAFKGCKSIETLLLPGLLEIIEDGAFSYCWGIKKVTVTSNLRINPVIFDRLYNSDKVEINYLKKPTKSSVSLSSNQLVISCMDNIPGRRDRNQNWKEASSIIMEEGIEELPMKAFARMENLQRVTLPKSLKKIGFGAFKDCSKLNNVVIPDTVTTISAHAFERCSCLVSISISDSVKYVGHNAFRGCPFNTAYVSSNCVICKGNYQIKNSK